MPRPRASKIRPYSPWGNLKEIERLLAVGAADEAYAQMLFKARFREGIGGCYHCGKVSPIMRRPLNANYVCPYCKGVVVETIKTPLYNSRIPMHIWFDCMYLLMRGMAKTYNTIPILAALYITEDYIMSRYGIKQAISAHRLKVGCRELVFPKMQGLWGDELPGEFIRETDKQDFMDLLKKACTPLSTS